MQKALDAKNAADRLKNNETWELQKKKKILCVVRVPTPRSALPSRGGGEGGSREERREDDGAVLSKQQRLFSFSRTREADIASVASRLFFFIHFTRSLLHKFRSIHPYSLKELLETKSRAVEFFAFVFFYQCCRCQFRFRFMTARNESYV